MTSTHSTDRAVPLAPHGATILGYPRIGRRRELKRALESHWAGRTTAAELLRAASDLRATQWRHLAQLGLDHGGLVSNTDSLYDQMLDTALLFGAIPDRFASIRTREGDTDLALQFAMARGTDALAPLELTKWFDTNYHYLVPEIGPNTPLALTGDTPLREHAEARTLGFQTRPVVVGPATFLLLSKPPADQPTFDPFDRLDELVDAYTQLLSRLTDAGVPWLQLDEPAFVTDRTDRELEKFADAYRTLGNLQARPQLLVCGPYGNLGDALPALLDTPVEAVGLDLTTGGDSSRLATMTGLRDRTLVAGVVDGRNVWRTDLRRRLADLAVLTGLAGEVVVSTSCSLMHVPYDVTDEHELDPMLKPWLAFADQKIEEVLVLARALRDGPATVAAQLDANTLALESRAANAHNEAVRTRVAALRPTDSTRTPFAQRQAPQYERLGLPALPTTTIGSFPQTDELRDTRAAHRAGRIDDDAYRQRMRDEIAHIVRLQEQMGLDVLVHGEPERNDMVQYFAEHLDGFATTTHGWVQSYGSRCVRPPILHSDVSRPAPITVDWTTWAASLTDQPMKGMLTGPVTILAWSFVRDDQPLDETARQIALAIRDEVLDLEAAGIAIIQVDEPALRELLPPREVDQPTYLSWSTEAFRIATSAVADTTQIHTHLCYSEFADIIDAIDLLDADVTSIEASRSRMEVIADLAAAGFSRGIGPGVYDIHSPRIPTIDEIAEQLRAALEALPPDRLWVNPDCGLKTRRYPEVTAALTQLVAAARQARPDT